MFAKIREFWGEVRDTARVSDEIEGAIDREYMILKQDGSSLVSVDEFVACFDLDVSESLGHIAVPYVKDYFHEHLGAFNAAVADNMNSDQGGGMWYMPIQQLSQETRTAISERLESIEQNNAQEYVAVAPLGVLFVMAFNNAAEFKDVKKKSRAPQDGDGLLEVFRAINGLTPYSDRLRDFDPEKSSGMIRGDDEQLKVVLRPL